MDNHQQNDNDTYTQMFLFELHSIANSTFFTTFQLGIIILLLIAILVRM